MLSISSASRIWLCLEPTDMRCSFDGLSARVRQHLGEDPLGSSSQWFAFINRRATQIKVLGFETGGYWIWSKRLERGHFARLMTRDGRVKRALCATEFLALLEGVDVEIKRQRKRYRTAA
jgi:transposase